MNDITTVTGIVGTIPKHMVTSNGVAITSFRLASGQRRFDKAKNAWVDADTNWYSVSAYRHLAYNVARSISKGDHLLITGRLRVRDWSNDERKGTNVDLEAESIGHDLFWCTTRPVRSAPSAGAVADADAAAAVPDRIDAHVPSRSMFDAPPQGGDGFLPTAPETAGLVPVDS